MCVLNQMMLGSKGQIDNFISPLLIQFFLRMASEKTRVRRPGRIKRNRKILIRTRTGLSTAVIVCHVIICPTRPDVPIPLPVALLVMPTKRLMAIGPRIADERISGIQIWGWRMIFGT